MTTKVKWRSVAAEFDTAKMFGNIEMAWGRDKRGVLRRLWRWSVDGKAPPFPNDNGGAWAFAAAKRAAEAAARKLLKGGGR